ncbi:adenylyltransferase/cytidyltransferase family protein [Snuella sedimenti]|uniref:Adenylyltransferase/cytidyltransferase family protein n=1 Tax=Snuella sedimenti TaxID=2798802 RepID=A0A8J7IKA8_9FLAO|nr:adenylyltransferase/cytidyltransferase family protein [Snuella sedimenti]MBJ6369736.1 adenylyltransferase/cytidyltransferase family protein [Snuella sedimenti]
MLQDIDIDLLELRFEKWDINFNESDESIKVTGALDNCSNELFELLKEICLVNKYNLTIELRNENKINVLVKKGGKKKKYFKMYTSGCFDIFHYGHLNILEKSKELCDYLIVGVSTDELIEKEKGKRPIIPFEERIKLVRAIKFVDEVIPQVDKNKQRIVDKYNIDAISVGDDWLGKFPKTSCPVEYFSYTENISSTIIKNTLQLL